jgi:hypothetical protein
MNKNNKVLSIFTMVAVFAMGIAAHSYQNAAAAAASTLNCAPNCFNEVSDHIREAQDKIDASDVAGAQGELSIVKALIDQLKQTTDVPSSLDAE